MMLTIVHENIYWIKNESILYNYSNNLSCYTRVYVLKILNFNSIQLLNK